MIRAVETSWSVAEQLALEFLRRLLKTAVPTTARRC